MSKRKVHSSKRQTRSTSKGLTKTAVQNPLFVGLSLSGGKSPYTSLVGIEYYAEAKKLFVTQVVDHWKSEENHSADQQIIQWLETYKPLIDRIGVDAPLALPICMTCQLKCPGYEICKVPEISWQREFFAEINLDKKPKKTFTPYTQRCVDSYLQHGLEQNFEVSHALGANLAPQTARLHFLSRRLKMNWIEVHPRISVWRIGRHLKLSTATLKSFKHPADGYDARSSFLDVICDRRNIFIYEQDRKTLIDSYHVFEAFIIAYTAFLQSTGEVQKKPKDLPKNEVWPAIPL